MIGLLPAAGKAERIHGLPKFLLPVPADSYLLKWHIEHMQQAGVIDLLIGTIPSSADWIEFTQYLYTAKNSATMTQTVLSGRDYTYDERVLFGMPDVYFTDTTAYQQVAAVDADVVVGCFRIPPNEQHKHDLVRAERGRVVEVLNKPAPQSSLQCTWGILLWKPIYWRYLQPDDPHVGHGLPRAIADGLDVRPVVIEGGYWNIGDTETYFDMIRTINQPEKVEA